ncbi:hypothetical protein CC80DRAFT_494267 [Byssothecium circinans]|uniref:Uncharacterized protein n=1 Tax=Byssothecium circinans TaxID=147558 RepID=A0A6A5TPZ6_9PLEO|nr:hypothetical protein CC80DRAFT_494267 [Byssothecium circinans]
MALSRAYIPSSSLLRALARPLPPRCPFARPLPTHFLRGKRTKKVSAGVTVDDKELKAEFPGYGTFRIPNTPEMAEEVYRPLTEEEINDPDMPVIEWYEQDLDQGTPERLIQRIATPEDRRRYNDTAVMIQEDMENPDYDNAHLRRRLLDDLMTNPNFSDLTKELQELKATILTREEQKALDEKLEKQEERKLDELQANLEMGTHESIQELINDPALADAKADLLELQERIPDGNDDWDSSDFAEMLQKVEAKLSANPAFMKRLEEMQAQEGVDPEKLNAVRQQFVALDENEIGNSPEGLEKLLVQMRDLMGAMGGDKQVEDELDALIKEDPLAETEENDDEDRELDFSQLSKEITKLTLSQAPGKNASPTVDEESEKVDPELEAKVDEIMKDPKLMEKLMYIQKLVTEAQEQGSDITNIPHQVAPDPSTLPRSRTAGLQERLAVARSTPEHVAALTALRVRLPSPFNVSPALKSFNQAMELAYVGANDDVRRILWRAYYKARTLPTFLESLSDDAWDLLYYSQAVTWGSNRNRVSHLKVLLDDLKSVGRDGPPTHPSTLVPS